MMTLHEFQSHFDVSPSSIHVHKKRGSLPSYIFSRRGRTLIIDETYLIRRLAFRTKLKQENTLLYYYLQSQKVSVTQISRLISDHFGLTTSKPNPVMYNTVRDSILANIPDSIMFYRVSHKCWLVNKYHHYLLRKLRKSNPSFTFEEAIYNTED